jgi:hypothetical protein
MFDLGADGVGINGQGSRTVDESDKKIMPRQLSLTGKYRAFVASIG